MIGQPNDIGQDDGLKVCVRSVVGNQGGASFAEYAFPLAYVIVDLLSVKPVGEPLEVLQLEALELTREM